MSAVKESGPFGKHRRIQKSRVSGRFSTVTYDGRSEVDINRLLRSKEVKKKLDVLDRAIGGEASA